MVSLFMAVLVGNMRAGRRQVMGTGEAAAWEQLKSLAPEDVCSRTGATFAPESDAYSLDMFNGHVVVSPCSCEVSGGTPQLTELLGGQYYFARTSILGFLIHGQNLSPSGRLVMPGEMPGVDVMVRGSHTLPLAALSGKYGENADEFLRKGEGWGGVPEPNGDASLRLHPFKSLPVVLILWTGDDEFTARSSLLLDSNSRFQAPPDILWSVMMLSVLMLL